MFLFFVLFLYLHARIYEPGRKIEAHSAICFSEGKSQILDDIRPLDPNSSVPEIQVVVKAGNLREFTLMNSIIHDGPM